MKYYRAADQQVHAYESDGSQDHLISDGMRLMTKQEIYKHLNPPPTLEDFIARENAWREAQLIAIANQLDALEEAEAGAAPVDLFAGTRLQWLQYRGQVRNWKEGAEHFPDASYRPVRPS